MEILLYTLPILGLYCLPALAILWPLYRFLARRRCALSGSLRSLSALARITAMVFSPCAVILALMAAFSFTGLDGQVSWLEMHPASMRDEAAWHIFILFALTWPFFVFYLIGGIIVIFRLFRRHVRTL